MGCTPPTRVGYGFKLSACAAMPPPRELLRRIGRILDNNGMFCSTCGKDINPDLSFCNYCGARTGAGAAAGENELSESSFNLIAGALLTTPLVGIGLILALVYVMKRELGLSEDLIGPVVMLCFFLLAASEGGFIWLMLKRTRGRKARPNKAKKNLLNEAETRRLAEGRQDPIPASVYDVTDHTTRTLDQVPRTKTDR